MPTDRRRGGPPDDPYAVERRGALLDAILDITQTAIVASDETGRVIAYSPTLAAWHPEVTEDAPPPNWALSLEIFAEDEVTPLAPLESPVGRALAGEDVHEGRYVIRGSDGALHHRRVNGRALVGEGGRPLGSVVSIHDHTPQHRLELQLKLQAHADALTELPGRAGIISALTDRVAAPGRRTAVLFLDLDHFKLVNDGYGHSAGDALLHAVAQRLRAVVREEDVVGRLGGDEFVILTNAEEEGATVQLARRLCEEIARPVRALGRELSSTASVGIAIQRSDEDTAESLLRDADTAMYMAKEAGRDRWAVFDEQVRQRVLERIHGEAQLRAAIPDGRLRVVYQPIIRAVDGRLRGVEALVRLVAPDGTLVQPSAFIPIAEQTGLITRIDAWILDAATRQGGAWLVHDQRRRVCVNLSARSLAQEGLPERIAGALARNQLPPHLLSVELTETALLAATLRSREALTELSEMGVRIGLDDFGTGYSSLTHLRSFPVSFVKIDRSFVAELEVERQSATIVAAIINLAHSLGHTVVAEGVETARQAELLTDLGCDLLQGYYFGRPVEAELPPNPPTRAPDTPMG